MSAIEKEVNALNWVLQVMLTKWNGKLIVVSLLLNLTPLGLLYIKKYRL